MSAALSRVPVIIGRRLNSRAEFNKLLTRANASNGYKVLALTLPRQQLRFFQSPKKANDAGFIDTLVGVYDDPNYPLDLKPDEFRDGQVFYYLSEFGVLLVVVSCVMVFFLCCSFLAWHTFFDSHTTVMRSNPHPYLAIRHGLDLHATRNPILSWTWPIGPHQDNKIRFYYEIRDAIERKKKMSQ